MPNPLRMTDDELAAELDGALGQSTSYGAASYLDEINRRAVERQSKELIALTASIRDLTAEIRGLTRLALLVAGASLVVAVVALVKA